MTKNRGKHNILHGFVTSSLYWWTGHITKRPKAVLFFTVLLTAAVLVYTVVNFNINTDINDLVSHDMQFRKTRKDFNKVFPALTDTLVVVIDADTPESAIRAHDRMTELLEKKPGIFKRVYQAGGEEFFRKNGLLFKSTEELEDLADNLAEVQPFLGLMSDDLTLRGLFSMLQEAMNAGSDTEVREERLAKVFDHINEAFESVIRGRPYHLSWYEIMLDEEPAEHELRKFIILQPAAESSGGASIREVIHTVRSTAAGLDFEGSENVEIRITGKVALDYENLLTVRKSAGIASMVSLLLVGLVLYTGLGSARLVFAGLATLLTGLVWTTGFAIGFIGSLNLISITFAVLFIGLGIDYSIQFCLRYRELITSGAETGDSITRSAQGVGKSLLLCSVTTSVGFYAFVPTAYAGVSELGLIAGTGMFINLFANLTVLPAILTVLPLRGRRKAPFSLKRRFSELPYTHAGPVAVVIFLLGLGAVLLFPRVSFDYNPLSLYDQSAESVITAQDLFEGSDVPLWTASALTGDLKAAEELAKDLKEEEEVEKTVALADFVPENQSEKLDIIYDMSLFMPELPVELNTGSLSLRQKAGALKEFEQELKQQLSSQVSEAYHASVYSLYETVRKFNADLENQAERSRHAADEIEQSLLVNLPVLMKNLNTSLTAERIEMSDLPGDIVDHYVSTDGRYRVQIFPAENITDNEALKRFVNAVYEKAPDATDSPVVVLETGKTIISSFRQATLSALAVIAVILFLILRSLSGTVLVLIPLLISIMLTAAATVISGITFNYANIIVVPLLLGIGVDNGIHFIHRFRTEPPVDGNMLRTSTARAVLFSSLTTIVSFTSLSFSSHVGTASMGKLLTICMCFLILNTLVLLPALLSLYSRRTAAGKI